MTARYGCHHPRVIGAGRIDSCPRCGRVRSADSVTWREPTKREVCVAEEAAEKARATAPREAALRAARWRP